MIHGFLSSASRAPWWMTGILMWAKRNMLVSLSHFFLLAKTFAKLMITAKVERVELLGARNHCCFLVLGSSAQKRRNRSELCQYYEKFLLLSLFVFPSSCFPWQEQYVRHVYLHNFLSCINIHALLCLPPSLHLTQDEFQNHQSAVDLKNLWSSRGAANSTSQRLSRSCKAERAEILLLLANLISHTFLASPVRLRSVVLKIAREVKGERDKKKSTLKQVTLLRSLESYVIDIQCYWELFGS